MTTDADTLEKFLADAVDDGTISLALADRMLSNAVRNAEPCITCGAGRGRQCIAPEHPRAESADALARVPSWPCRCTSWIVANGRNVLTPSTDAARFNRAGSCRYCGGLDR